MNMHLKGATPGAFFRTSLAHLAETVGGYKDGNDFVEHVLDIVGDDSDKQDAGIQALARLIDNIDGADRALNLTSGDGAFIDEVSGGDGGSDGLGDDPIILTSDLGALMSRLAGTTVIVAGDPAALAGVLAA